MEYQKFKLFVPTYANVDYESATKIIIDHAERNISFGVSALAVHGLMESVTDANLRTVVNDIDLIVPDGQPIRWALNSFYKLGMRDRVYGPTLTLHVLEAAGKKGLKVYLYGSTAATLEKFQQFIVDTYPEVKIAGIHEDRFREATPEEDEADIKKINESGAHIVLVGRGCPRQELWVADHKGKIHAAMMAVGAAFDFHAGNVTQAPKWMQDNGLEWFYRLLKEPGRLWKRYLVTNAHFVIKFMYHRWVLRRAS